MRYWHRAIALLRRPAILAASKIWCRKYREQVRTAPLDVVDEHAAHEAVQLAVKAFRAFSMLL